MSSAFEKVFGTQTPEEVAEEYAREKLGDIQDPGALRALAEAFLSGYLVGIMIATKDAKDAKDAKEPVDG